MGSWLGTIAVSLQGALGMVYIGEILLKSVPFTRCEVRSNRLTKPFYFLSYIEYFVKKKMNKNEKKKKTTQMKFNQIMFLFILYT